MPTTAIRLDRLKSRLEALARIGGDPSGGVSRFPYSGAHAQAIRDVEAWMTDAGLQTGCDEFGNLIGVRPGSADSPAILLASHLDTVPHGGMFDGALGVLAGVEVAQTLADAGWDLRHGLAVVGFADEEGYWFGTGTLASRCLVGDVGRQEFASLSGRDGRTLAEALAAFAPGVARASVPARVAAYLELHVEQGPVLWQTGRRAAAVEAITGIARTTVTFEGEANHAGTTPMAARRDALIGASEVILAVKALADASGGRGVGTVGALAVAPGAANVVPGRAECKVEFRSPDADRLSGLCGDAEASIRSIAQRHRLEVRVDPWDRRAPVAMDAGIVQTIRTAIADAGHEPLTVPSWAGHDAMILAPYLPVGMIFVPSINGISHSPAERTEWEDIGVGADVLLRTILLLDERRPLPARVLPIGVS